MSARFVFTASAILLADLRTSSWLVFAQLLLDTGRTGDARARAQEVVDLAQVRGDVIFEARARSLIDRGAAKPGSH